MMPMSQALFWAPPLHPLVVSAHDMESAETLLGAAEFVVIFLAARLLAEVLVRLSLPTLIGELVAGVIIGASGLHLVLPPEVQSNISTNLLHLVSGLSSVPKEAVDEIYAETAVKLASFAQVGLYALLFLTGLESDLNQLLKVGVRALGVATVGVILPFAAGTLGLIYFFDVDVIPAVFAGAALTATSIGITAKVFGELKYLKTSEGQTVIGAAVLDDILGIVILAVVAKLATGGSLAAGPIVKLLVAAVAFVAVSLFLSRTAAPWFDRLVDALAAPGEKIVCGVIVLSLGCFVATAIGLEAVLGAFAAGLVLSSSKHVHELTALTEPIVALFATLFFVMIGTGFDFSVINPLNPDNHGGLVMAGFLLVVAILGKVATGWAYWSKEKTNRLAVGLGMMPRGEVGLVFLALGGSTHVLSSNLEAAILLMVIGTTFLAPLLLRLVLPATDDDPEPELASPASS